MPTGCETKGKLLIGPKVEGPLRALGTHTSMMVTKQVMNEAELCWNAGERTSHAWRLSLSSGLGTIPDNRQWVWSAGPPCSYTWWPTWAPSTPSLSSCHQRVADGCLPLSPSSSPLSQSFTLAQPKTKEKNLDWVSLPSTGVTEARGKFSLFRGVEFWKYKHRCSLLQEQGGLRSSQRKPC